MDQTVFNKMTNDKKFYYANHPKRRRYPTEEERDALRHALISAQLINYQKERKAAENADNT